MDLGKRIRLKMSEHRKKLAAPIDWAHVKKWIEANNNTSVKINGNGLDVNSSKYIHVFQRDCAELNIPVKVEKVGSWLDEGDGTTYFNYRISPK